MYLLNQFKSPPRYIDSRLFQGGASMRFSVILTIDVSFGDVLTFSEYIRIRGNIKLGKGVYVTNIWK